MLPKRTPQSLPNTGQTNFQNTNNSYNKFVSGSCDFTDKVATFNGTNHSTQNVFSGTVDANSGITKWTIKIINLQKFAAYSREYGIVSAQYNENALFSNDITKNYSYMWNQLNYNYGTVNLLPVKQLKFERINKVHSKVEEYGNCVLKNGDILEIILNQNKHTGGL